MRKLEFKLARNVLHLFDSTYTTCIGGCDPNFNETMNIKDDTIKKISRITDSGYETTINRSEVLSRSQVRNNTGESISNSRMTTQRSENHSRNSNNRRKGNIGSTKMENNADNFNRTIGFGNNHTNTNDIVSWGNIDNDAEIMCQCHQHAIQLTVRKDGPNQGKLYLDSKLKYYEVVQQN